jgi:hypothetical protein
MVASIGLDIVQGPTRPIALILVGMFAGMVLMESGILAMFGMKPIGKAFTTTFLANMAACGTGFVFWMIAVSAGWEGVGSALLTVGGATFVQGLMIGKNPANLTLARAWWAAVAMKAASLVILIVIVKLLDL